MRSVRAYALAVLLTTALTACGTSAGNNDGNTTPSAAASSAAASPSAIAVPELTKGEVTNQGDICRLIPANAVATVLDHEALEASVITNFTPSDVDGCTYSHVEGHTPYSINLSVGTNPDEVFNQVQFVAKLKNYTVNPHSISGSAEAVYSNRAGYARVGDRVIAVNVFAGEAEENKVMAVLGLAVKTIG